MRQLLAAAAAVLLTSTVASAADDGAAGRMFGAIAGLSGDWEGRFEWTQGRTGSGPMRASYRLTGNGSAIVEDLIQDGKPFMTTVYHLDGATLRMTHYCAARNQPRLKASKIDEAARAVDFEFVDMTGNRVGHVEHFFLQLVAPDQLLLRFDFGGAPGAKGNGVETITLRRVSKT